MTGLESLLTHTYSAATDDLGKEVGAHLIIGRICLFREINAVLA